MAKPVSNPMDIEDAEGPEPINSCIKEFMTLRESVEKSNRKTQQWLNQTSKLIQSNRNIEANYDDLLLKIPDIEDKISENTGLHCIKKQELKSLEIARTQTSRKQWDHSLSEIGNYANDFSQWITKYSKDVLMEDIRNHGEECKEVSEELALLKKEVNDMQRKYDLDDIKANVDVNDLPNLNTVMADIKPSNNDLIHTVRLTEDTLNKIQNKIKQSEIAVNEYKMKENSNIF